MSQLYLWEPEIDLHYTAWNAGISEFSSYDFPVLETLEKYIETPHAETRQAAPHIEAFFNYVLEALQKPEYAPYFDKLKSAIAYIAEDLEDFKHDQRPIYVTLGYLFNYFDFKEYQRVIFDAIEASGVCAYHGRFGFLFPTSLADRRSTFSDVADYYPALTVPPEHHPISFGETPQNLQQMHEIVEQYMQQHQVGQGFTFFSKENTLDHDGAERYTFVYKKQTHELIHVLTILVIYNPNVTNYIVAIHYEFQWGHLYFNPQELKQIDTKQFQIAGEQIRDFGYKFSIPLENLRFLQQNNLELMLSISKNEDYNQIYRYLDAVLSPILIQMQANTSFKKLMEFMFLPENFKTETQRFLQGETEGYEYRDVSKHILPVIYSQASSILYKNLEQKFPYDVVRHTHTTQVILDYIHQRHPKTIFD